jgi:hypothetical protein
MMKLLRSGRATCRLVVGRANTVLAGASRIVAHLQARREVVIGLRIAATVLALATTTAGFLLLNKQLFHTGLGYDEEFFIAGGWAVRKGLALYRDFLEFKPPMVFLTHAAAQALFGLEEARFRMFFLLFPLASLLAFHLSLMARGIGRMLSTGAVLAIVSLFVNQRWHDTSLTDSESIGLSYYLLGLAALLWEGRYVKITTALGGALMSLCVMSKEPFLAVVAATWLAMFWLRCGAQPTRASAGLFARFSLVGVGIAAACLCLYLLVSGALGPYLAMAVRYARIYSDPQRSYCVVLGYAHPSTPWLTFVETWGRLRRAFLNEATLGYLVPFVVPGFLFAWRRRRALALCMLAVAMAALWAPTASKCMWRHYYNMSIAGLAFVVAVGLDSMQRALQDGDPVLRAGAGIAALLLALVHAGPDLGQQWNTASKRPPWKEPQPGVVDFIRANTTANDRILTTGTPMLYVVADRVGAVRETNFTDELLGSYDGETDEERLRPLREQLRRNHPKVVFLDPEHQPRKRRHYQALVMPFLAELRYRKVNDQLYVLP